jgi:hypothetical protein
MKRYLLALAIVPALALSACVGTPTGAVIDAVGGVGAGITEAATSTYIGRISLQLAMGQIAPGAHANAILADLEAKKLMLDTGRAAYNAQLIARGATIVPPAGLALTRSSTDAAYFSLRSRLVTASGDR